MDTRPRSRLNPLPLFHAEPDVWNSLAEPDVWNSLDEPTQERVLDCLGLLLLRHLQPTARCVC